MVNSVPRSGFTSNFLAILATHMLGRSIRFVYLIVIARLLSPAEVGIYTYGVALYLAFLGISQFGQQGILSTRIGRNRAGILNLVAHSLTVRIVATVVVTALLLIFAVVTESDDDVFIAILFFVLTLVPRSLVLWVRNCYVALEQTVWIPRWELGFRSAEAIVGTLVLLNGGDLVAICFLHFFFWLIEAVAALHRLVTQARVPFRLGHNARYLTQLVRQSVSFMLSLWLVEFFLIVGVVVVRGLQTDAAAVGYFGVAMQFFTTFVVIFIALGDTLLPKLSRAYNQDNAAGINAVPLLMRAMLIGGVPLAIIANALLPPMIQFLLGVRYAAVGPIFADLSWSIGPYAFVLLAMQALNSARKPRIAVVVAAVPAVLLIGLMMTWAGDGGLYRSAWSLVVAAFIGAAVAAVALKVFLRQEGAGRNLTALILLIAASQATRLDFISPGWGMLWVLIVYVALVVAMRLFTLSDISTLRALRSSQKKV